MLVGALIVILVPYVLKKMMNKRNDECTSSFDGAEKLEEDAEDSEEEEDEIGESH